MLDIIIEPGVVTCEIQGSRSTPYIAAVEVSAGDGMPLRRDIRTNCTCPDDDNWDGYACKHVVAAMFTLSDEFLLEPELLDLWRNRTTDTTADRSFGVGSGQDRGDGDGAAPAIGQVATRSRSLGGASHGRRPEPTRSKCSSWCPRGYAPRRRRDRADRADDAEVTSARRRCFAMRSPTSASTGTDTTACPGPSRATPTLVSMSLHAAQVADALLSNVDRVVRGKRDEIRLALCCLLTEGHLLIDDVPGTGKTSMAKAIAGSIAGSWKRVQFTPDLLPSDITGVMVFDQRTSSFSFRQGPVFTNVLIGDEINRASPKTQSALLEVMEERQVTADGVPHLVPRPFFVIATQNPRDFHGTFPLPDVQLDRFAMKLSLGYADQATEVVVLEAYRRENRGSRRARGDQRRPNSSS